MLAPTWMLSRSLTPLLTTLTQWQLLNYQALYMFWLLVVLCCASASVLDTTSPTYQLCISHKLVLVMISSR